MKHPISKLAVWLVSTAMTVCAALAQDLTISTTPGEGGEASVRMIGINGNQELESLVPQYIKASGWLTLSGSTSADFELRGSANSTTCQYVLSSGGREITSGRVSFNTAREGARKVVDAMLQKIFPKEDVKELCQSKIAFCADLGKDRREIFTCDIAGGDVKQITDFKSLCVEPSWSPDSKSIGYTKYSTGSTTILQTRLSPLGTKRLTNLRGLNVGTSFSPDFTKIAFVGSFEDRLELYVQNLGSHSQLRLTNGPAVEASPCWNPAGDTVCYVSNEGGRVPRLFTVNLAAKSIKRLTTLGSEAATPDWSRQNRIVYAAKINGSYKLAVNDMNGEEPPKQIVSDVGEWESPSWAPDGRHIVCARTSGGQTSLYVVDSLKGTSRLLLKTKNKLTMPSWSPGAVR